MSTPYRSEAAASLKDSGPGSDVQLLQKMQQGDQDAVLLLYDRYSQLAYSIILRVLRDECVAEELMQDVFLQLWRQPGLYDPARGTLRAWIAVVCRHRAVDHLRKRRHEVDIDDANLSVSATQEESAGRAQFLGQIQTELSRMPIAERNVLELAYFEGYTHSEISAKTGQPLGTVKSRLRSAIGRLRTVFVEKAA